MKFEETSAALLRILIVESDQTIRELLTDLFLEQGHEATSVDNSRKALTPLEDGQFDLMLVAHPLSAFKSLAPAVNSLSEDDGLALARTAREDDPNLKIILLSFSEIGALPAAMTNGIADMIISKPFDVADIEQALVTLRAS